jgi:vancomycin resistance protein VanW
MKHSVAWRSLGAPAFSRLFGLFRLILLPIALLCIYWFTNPFANTLSSSTFSLSPLSAAQRTNIHVASQSLNGTIIKPGAEFSFNQIVGPRTYKTGYVQAPSYLGPDSPKTFGGGICLVSSALYQAALKSNLQVTKRVAHLRPIKTVQPGLDATVWYGEADLKFLNNSPEPIRIESSSDQSNLHVTIRGASPTRTPTFKTISKYTRNKLLVKVFKNDGKLTQLISDDVYDLR